MREVRHPISFSSDLSRIYPLEQSQINKNSRIDVTCQSTVPVIWTLNSLPLPDFFIRDDNRIILFKKLKNSSGAVSCRGEIESGQTFLAVSILNNECKSLASEIIIIMFLEIFSS